MDGLWAAAPALDCRGTFAQSHISRYYQLSGVSLYITFGYGCVQRMKNMVAMTKLILKAVFCVAALASFAGCSGQMAKPLSEAVNFCSPEQGAPFSYRKKVAVLAADVRNPLDANDLPALDAAWSEALQQRLSDSDRLLVVDAKDQHLHLGERQRDWIIALANRLDVQFVIAVQFHNLHVSRSQLGSGNYAIKLPRAQRQIDAELLIFDGYSGVQLASFSHSAYAKGLEQGLINPAHQPLLKGAFFDAPIGQAMASVLASQVEDGLNQLACLPLMARILKVAGGDIHIGTRGASLVRPGDTLQLFRRSGAAENHLGAVEIIRVFPESAIARYRGEGDAPRFSQGLLVRAW